MAPYRVPYVCSIVELLEHLLFFGERYKFQSMSVDLLGPKDKKS